MDQKSVSDVGCEGITGDAVHERPPCNPCVDTVGTGSGCSLDHSGQAQSGALSSLMFVSCFKSTPTLVPCKQLQFIS